MSPSASEVSVVTVNWNGRHHLEHLLPSLEPLGCLEVIVVDNGSQDGSQEFVRHWRSAPRLIENTVNRGFAHPINQGAEAARGRYLAFINNDMRADPGWLDEALPLMNAPTACVASRILDWEGRKIDFNGASLQYLGFALQKDIGRLIEEVTDSDCRILFPCGGAMLVDRRLFLELGGFDPDYFAVFEDVDWGWRVWLSGHEVALAPRSLTYHRSHGTFRQHGDEKLRYLMHRNALMTAIKNYEDPLFRRILPIAVRLGVKRAVLLSGVEKESFYLWSQSSHDLRSGDPLVQDRWIDALNHLCALDDVLESLPELLEKRRCVQALRRRSDEQILELFEDPLRAIVEDSRYQCEEAVWLKALELDSIFKPSEPVIEARVEEAQKRLKRLKSELGQAQWNAAYAWQRPPAPQRPGPRAVWKSLRRDGVQKTLKRIRARLLGP